jgi:hypothetical protein
MNGGLKQVLAYPLRCEMADASDIAIGTQISYSLARESE